MEVLPDIKIVDLGLYLAKHNTLVLADFHIGYEEALNKLGVLIPKFQFREIIKRLKGIFSQLPALHTIVVNGDIKHEFGTISEQEWRETLKLIDFLQRRCRKLVLVRGNHDTILGPIADKKGVEIADSFSLDDILILHGHKLVQSSHKTMVIAHEHPALGLREGARIERFKAFLAGKILGKALIVQPSFNMVAEGADLLREKALSPYLQQDLADFNVFVVADKIYKFGRIKDLD